MAIGTELHYATVEELCLDPTNPRLGRSNKGRDVPQSKVLEMMKDWNLEELAVSFLESEFWVQEALLVVEEKIYGKNNLVVVEGNRRLAALRFLKDASEGMPISRVWKEMVDGIKIPPNLFKKIPYLIADSRADINAFLGFRHVTGIQQWRPAEKAEYIAKLIEQDKMTYEEVMRKIGSRTQTVGQHYVSYKLLLQMENLDGISIEHVEDKFSVLYLSLRTKGVQQYLNIDIKAPAEIAKKPVPKDKLDALKNFALWLFGDEKHEPLLTDSRKVDKFGRILESKEAIDYLERADEPKFDVALRISGGDEPELIRLIERATDNVELVLGTAHHYKEAEKLIQAVGRLNEDVQQLTKIFPTLSKSISKE